MIKSRILSLSNEIRFSSQFLLLERERTELFNGFPQKRERDSNWQSRWPAMISGGHYHGGPVSKGIQSKSERVLNIRSPIIQDATDTQFCSDWQEELLEIQPAVQPPNNVQRTSLQVALDWMFV